MKTERLYFPNKKGDKLAAYLDLPAADSNFKIALFAHCFTCSKNLKTLTPFFRTLTESGFAVFRFDFTGIGMSQGDFSQTDLNSNVDDILAAVEFLQNRNQKPDILIGHSFGGTAVLKAAARVEEVRAVVTLAASFDPTHLAELLPAARNEAEEKGQASVSIGGQSYQLSREFFHNLEQHNMGEIIRSLDKPLLILHSPLDDTVPIDQATKLFQAAKHPKSFVSLHPADHLLSNEKHAKQAAHVIAGWAKGYIE